jgi:transcriptional regulator with GAF, ATPase, and Fis domain
VLCRWHKSQEFQTRSHWAMRKYSKRVIRSAKAKAIEREHILGALRETGWVVAGPKGAAARLGMKRSTLQEKMRKLGISRPQ